MTLERVTATLDRMLKSPASLLTLKSRDVRYNKMRRTLFYSLAVLSEQIFLFLLWKRRRMRGVDTDKLMRQIREQATERLKAQLREHVETIYCPEHGRFAELSETQVDLSCSDQMEFSYVTCCEAQKERVRLAVGGTRG